MNGGRGLVIAIAAAFIVGCSVGLMGGILFARFALHGPRFMRHGPTMMERSGPRGPERLLSVLDDELKLTPDQHARIVAILDRTRQKGQAVRDSMEAEISRVLTPDQQQRWKDMESRFERSRRLRGRPGPPIGMTYPNPGERTEIMNTSWWSMGLATLLAVGPVAVANAQEAPPPPRAEQGAPGFDRMDAAMGDEDLGPEMDLIAANDGPGEMGGGRGGERRAEMMKQLNLSDDQRKRLADIRDKRQREVIPIESNLKIAGLDFRKLVRADHPDTRAINAQIDRIASLRASMQKSRVAGMLEARSVLTPEQQQMLRDRVGGMRMHGPGRHGMRGQGSMR
jgi:Spy/CpxP family protein refolding chaperone